MRKALNYTPEDGDVILVTYPKSGSHWTQQIIQLILRDGESASSFTEFVKRTPSLENNGTAWLDGAPRPRTLRSHLQLLRGNFNDKAKYVYVARNPYDCCVSFYHMLRSVPGYGFQEGSFDDFFEAFLRGDFGFGLYFDHVEFGYSCRNRPNVLFLTYEELKADTPATVLKLAYFLGEEYGEKLEKDADLFERVLARSSFEYMQRVLSATVDEFS